MVIVRGRVVRLGDALALIPASPPGVAEDEGRAITLTGADLPPLGRCVSARGDLVSTNLDVAGWHAELVEAPAWSIPRDLPGVDPSVSEQVLASVPDEWETISTGESTVSAGNVAVLELYRVPADFQVWLARQEPGSVIAFPFIRDEHAPEMWMAGQ